MGRRGPAPSPTALRVLRGDRKAKINNAEPVPSELAVRMPEFLGPASREVWERLAPDLEKRGVLTAWDVDTFAMWCSFVALHAEAARKVAELGPLVKGPRGTMVRNPAVMLQRQCAAQVASIGAKFGLDPSSRQQLRIDPPATHRPGDDLLS